MIKKIKFIDLDLPSGNLWGNKDLPGYYQWGSNHSTISREILRDPVNWARYDRFTKEKEESKNAFEIIKYNDSDNLRILQPEDDIVTRLFGENYRIPRLKDFEELLDHIDKASLINLPRPGTHCGLWSSTRKGNNHCCAYLLSFKYGLRRTTASSRDDFLKIRPIKIK